MKTFFLSFAGALAALIAAFFGLIFLFFFFAAANAPPPQPSSLVLSVDLRNALPDKGGQGVEAFFGTSNGFIDLLEKIDRASSDPAVKGMFIRGSEGAYGSARAEELRDALTVFRQSGKFVVAHTQDNYAIGPSGYTTLSAADEIWMQPGTDLFLSGITFESLFLRDLFDKLSIKSEIQALYEYKNAPNQYSETGYTDAHREAMTVLGQSIWDTSLDSIAADRDLDRDAVAQRFSNGPTPAQQALEIGLVDKIGYPEEAREAALARASGSSLRSVASYQPPAISRDAPLVAVISGEGGIFTGDRVPTLFNSEPVMSSDVIARDILKAGKSENVDAIVFRVNSPGGSPTASDQIWHAIERVQEMGKPVVISMGSYAASGGYYVSTGADYIMANANTITGSIGIYGGKIAIADGLRRVGINSESIVIGDEFASVYSADAYSDRQKQIMRDWLQRGYDRFTGLVAEGRDMPLEDIQEIAKGRVWSGTDALDIGLVDEIGGFMDAVRKASELAGKDTSDGVRVTYLPKARSPLENLGLVAASSVEAADAAGDLAQLLSDPRVQAVIQEMELAQGRGAKAATPIWIEN